MKDETRLLIGFDAKRIVRNATGLGNYSRTLIKNLLSWHNDRFSLRLYAPDRGKDNLRKQICEDERVRYVFPVGRMPAVGRAWWRFSGIVRELKRDRIDIFHGLSGELPRGLKASGTKGIVTIHDLIFLRFPRYYHWWDVMIYRYKFRLACREAHRIIAVSERTKQDIIEYGRVAPDKIAVIYQDCDASFKQPVAQEHLQRVRAKYALPHHYILNVGSIEERKNVLLAVKALEGLPTDLRLVIVGRHTPYTDRVAAYIEAHGLSDRVQMLHHVSFADLPAIYQLARTFVYPSRYEGFGIPIIEAIYSGLPVVACTGSCLEEAGGPDSFYVDPDDVAGMRAALTAAETDNDREARIARCREYVRKFEAQKLTAALMGEYLRLAEQ